MSRMRAGFEQVAGQAAPPTRLSADGVYAEALRRRRANRTRLGAGVATLLAAGVGLSLLTGGVPAPWPVGQPGAGGRPLLSVMAGDAEHLFVTVEGCPGPAFEPDHCGPGLFGSDDGGRTWTERQDVVIGQVSVPVPGVVFWQHPQEGSSISQDGGLTWRDIQPMHPAIAEVPHNGWVTADCPASPSACRLVAYDPASFTSFPLGAGPALIGLKILPVPAESGIWITGRERLGEHRPVVAVSRDRGRRWAVHTFTDAGDPTYGVTAASTDGVTGYAMLGPQAYRTIDAGDTWQRTDRLDTLPDPTGESFVAADGSHVVPTGPGSWYSSRDGNDYQLTRLDGVRPPVHVIAPGLYVASDRTAVHRSTDGLHWTRIPVTIPR
ncbi:hypothetical protein Dvina_14155 [Dactylosporangium vinaceum]|uniref:Exo-alpha-sialidase n=1 Tax=Dactylosporangium vinaceum TaxID=53362 RepID=A0ABV5MHN4_9ACTN|nr:exo-alpha-sialidase [Dactylosporangium vinaceum]UAB99113.1 hypothetical protein Dvina_14155 [Dactylosporangium vinaceum]